MLYAPWRELYARSIDTHKKGDANACVFCVISASDADKKHYVLHRGTHTFTLLNLYPYNAGHILVVPHAHHEHLFTLDSAVQQELIHMISVSSHIVAKTLGCHGVNIGLNIGKVAGAGIPEHLHAHVLPRWTGDTNFLPLLAGTKLVSFELQDIYNKLKKPFEALP